jgi:hypothetical protein
MSEGLEKLRSLGAQKIYEDTHIPLQQIRSILEEFFDDFNKVQLSGFISILEREYSIELEDLRVKSSEHFLEKSKSSVDKGIFVTPESKPKSGKGLYIFIILILFVGVVVYNIKNSNESSDNLKEISEPLVENVESYVAPQLEQLIEENASKETLDDMQTELNATTKEEVSKPEVVVEEKAVQDSFKIVAKTKVWAGYIDTETNRKYQKTFKGELDLDPNKSWLLVFGHPLVYIYVDGKQVVFKSKKSKRFFYSNGTIRNITAKEFKRINRGRRW